MSGEDGVQYLREEVLRTRVDVDTARGYLAARQAHLETLEAQLRAETAGPIVYIRVPSWALMPEFGSRLEVLMEASGAGFWWTLDRATVGDSDPRIARLRKMLEGKHEGNMIRVGRILEVLDGDNL